MPGIMANMTAIPDSQYKPAGTGGEVAMKRERTSLVSAGVSCTAIAPTTNLSLWSAYLYR